MQLFRIFAKRKTAADAVKTSCSSCKFFIEEQDCCIVGTYYANKGLKRICYGGEEWIKKPDVMTKEEKILEEIQKREKEIQKLRTLLNTVSGETIEICPVCKTRNLHWNALSNTFTCACC